MSQTQYELPTIPPRELAAPISFRFPTITEGFSIWDLAKASGRARCQFGVPLSVLVSRFSQDNSRYLSRHSLVGFAAGFMGPTESNTLFI